MLTALLCCFVLPLSGDTWTELGPKFAGRVSAIAATNANNVWLASPGGGVWKSTDGGANFTWAGNYGLGDFTAVHLALDRNDPTRMYLRTWSGVLVSTDGAAHWTRTLYSLPQGDAPYPYPSFCSSWPACPPFANSHPDEPHPWAQAVFSPSQSVIVTALPCQGLQYSIDSGNHFTQLWPFAGPTPQQNPDNCINSIAVDDITHKVWFTTMNDATHVYRSSAAWTAAGPPAGMTWQFPSSGLPPAGHTPAAIAWAGGTADKMMMLVYTGSDHVPYLFDGATWIAKPWNNPACAMVDARALVAGSGNDFYAGGVTFAYTLNNGDTWTCPSLGSQWSDIRAIFASPAAHRLWIGGDQNGLGGNALMTRFTWNPGVAPSAPVPLTANGLSTWQSYSMAKAPASNRLIVGAQDVGVACSDNDGLNWVLTPPDEKQSIVWAKSGGGNTLYGYGTQTTMHKTTNAASAATCGAISWSNVSPPDMLKTIKIFSAPRTMTVDPMNASKVFALIGGRVLYSTNGGGAWQKSDLGLMTPSGYTVGLTAIFVDEAGVVYVGAQDHGVYTCSDTTHYCDGSVGAGAWTPFALNAGGAISPPWYITGITESNPPPAARTFWISTSQGVYRKRPADAGYTAVDAISLYPYSDVVVDPTCKSRIYSAMGYLNNQTRTRGGIHVSTDNGDHWRSITSSFPLHNVPVTEIFVDTAHPDRVYASTYGRGVWRFNWTTPMPACAP